MLAPAVTPLALRLVRLRLLLRFGLRARERSRLGRLSRRLDERQFGLRRVVGAEEPGLPAVEIGLVADVEEQHPGDGGLTVRELDRAGVVLALHRLRNRVRGRGDAQVRVDAELVRRDLRLDAVLAVEDRQGGAA